MYSLENKIKLFVVKCQMKKDILKMRMQIRLNEVKRILGDKASNDPYGEEDWES